MTRNIDFKAKAYRHMVAKGDDPDLIEDAIGYDEERGLFVVADGVTNSTLGALMAAAIAGALSQVPFPDSPGERYELRERWQREWTAGRDELRRNGGTRRLGRGVGASTFVAVSVEDIGEHGVSVRINAVGDSCCFLVHPTSGVQRSFPLSHANQFSSSTPTVSADPHVPIDVKVTEWRDVRLHEWLVLASDALAQWLLRSPDNWRSFRTALERRSLDNLIRSERDAGRMTWDDVSLILVWFRQPGHVEFVVPGRNEVVAGDPLRHLRAGLGAEPSPGGASTDRSGATEASGAPGVASPARQEPAPHQPTPQQGPHQPAPHQPTPQQGPHQPAPHQPAPHQPAPHQPAPHQPAPQQVGPQPQGDDAAPIEAAPAPADPSAEAPAPERPLGPAASGGAPPREALAAHGRAAARPPSTSTGRGTAPPPASWTQLLPRLASALVLAPAFLLTFGVGGLLGWYLHRPPDGSCERNLETCEADVDAYKELAGESEQLKGQVGAVQAQLTAANGEMATWRAEAQGLATKVEDLQVRLAGQPDLEHRFGECSRNLEATDADLAAAAELATDCENSRMDMIEAQVARCEEVCPRVTERCAQLLVDVRQLLGNR